MKATRILLFVVLAVAFFFRLYGNNWDQGFHLHPDERFLTMVGIDVKLPTSFSDYLNPHTSSFNPVNKGHAFYVYGTFPILLNKVLATLWYNDTYDTFNLQGRILSGLADFLLVLLIYKICELLEKKWKLHSSVKIYAAFLYGIAVLPIQLSHFFAADTFLNLFSWLSFYFVLKIAVDKKSGVVGNMIWAGLFFGLALACKISALYFAPLIGFVMIYGLFHRMTEKRSILGCLLFILCAYFALRLGAPYYFETGSFLNPQIGTAFINNIRTLKSYDNPQILFPPANQWINAPLYLSPLNMIVFGVGIVYFITSCIGIVTELMKKRTILLIGITAWALLFLIYQSVQFAKTMRYLLFLYPVLALYAAFGLRFIQKQTERFKTPLKTGILILYVVALLVWPLAFFSIYTKDHSRVSASRWIYEHIPAGSVLLSEYWDDGLPLSMEEALYKKYRGIEVHIFDLDTKEKWDIMNVQLQNGDYYIMSSNRGWGSIPTVPKRYPVTSKFYAAMMKGEAEYSLVKEFTSYPSLGYLGIPIDFPDQWSEEAFTVYDHPKVMIFKKNK
ncbi:MAG: hypothetical protein WAV30_05610 [Microgenomates group bacterium]